MSNKPGSLGSSRGFNYNEQPYSRQLFTEWQGENMYNNNSSSDDEFVEGNLVQLLSQSQKVTSSTRAHLSNDFEGNGVADSDNSSRLQRSPDHSARHIAPFSTETARSKKSNSQERNKNDESGYMSRNVLQTGNTLTKGSRSQRNGNNTLNRRLMSTGQSMLTSSSSTISSVSNNIERERDNKDTASRKMTDVPRYYVMESDIPDIQPPDPAPPEVPPRAHSLNSASSRNSMSIRKKSDYVLKIDKNGDQTHEEYIPPGQHEYLRNGSPKMTGVYPSRSPSYNESQQANRLQPTLQSNHQQMSQGMSSTNTNTGSRLGGSSPIVMPVFPLRTSHSGHASHYSPYSPSRFHIDKRCQHRCSWKCFSIALILLSVILTAMLAYFAATSSMKTNIDSTNCILVQDVKSNAQDQITSDSASATSNLGTVAGIVGSNG